MKKYSNLAKLCFNKLFENYIISCHRRGKMLSIINSIELCLDENLKKDVFYRLKRYRSYKMKKR